MRQRTEVQAVLLADRPAKRFVANLVCEQSKTRSVRCGFGCCTWIWSLGVTSPVYNVRAIKKAAVTPTSTKKYVWFPAFAGKTESGAGLDPKPV
jgi:hypothetical protein